MLDVPKIKNKKPHDYYVSVREVEPPQEEYSWSVVKQIMPDYSFYSSKPKSVSVEIEIDKSCLEGFNPPESFAIGCVKLGLSLGVVALKLGIEDFPQEDDFDVLARILGQVMQEDKNRVKFYRLKREAREAQERARAGRIETNKYDITFDAD